MNMSLPRTLTKTIFIIIPDADMVWLFRLFLNMYDVKPSKLKRIEKLSEIDDEKEFFRELYQLPGVKG